MSIGVLFWILWIVAAIFGGMYFRANWQMSLLTWVLFGLLGWGVFGFPIHG